LEGDYEWVIQDHYRRWAINVTEEFLAPTKNISFAPYLRWEIDQTKIPGLLNWLNNDSRDPIPKEIKDYFENGLLKYY